MAVEGSPFTNLLKLMKTQGYNKDNYVVIGIVSSTSPLTIDLDNITITEGQFFLAERLSEHTRDITIDTTSVNGDVTVPNSSGTLTSFQITEGTLTIKSPLKNGDYVLVLIDEDDFFVVDKVVSQ